jgi:hypothetical protein
MLPRVISVQQTNEKSGGSRYYDIYSDMYTTNKEDALTNLGGRILCIPSLKPYLLDSDLMPTMRSVSDRLYIHVMHRSLK